MKYTDLNQWLWKWHVIAGLVSLPFVLVLAITGGIYLFKDTVEKPVLNNLTKVATQGVTISFEEQLKIAESALGKKPNSVVIPVTTNQATEFVVGKFSHKKSVFVNPFSGEVTGEFTPKNTWMYSIRKLHGELLGGNIGTKIIELIASWMIVLIVTGIYIFWPARDLGWKGFFTIRTGLGRRILYRDIHALGGFWLSALLLLTLAGGLPWTDVFGGNFKKLQKMTNTGFPKEWFGVGVKSNVSEATISLDEMISIAKQQNLVGVNTLDLPKHKAGVFSVSNATFPLKNQKKIHFDQFSGKKLMTIHWSDVGILMRGRMWIMAFHQGQLGDWNFVLMLFVAIGLGIISIAGLLSFKMRNWGIPTVPESFKLSYGLVFLVLLLGVLLPLFGGSLLILILFTWVKNKLFKL
ncbi:PepSY-associated TM helix domain-containing protein [Aquimarina agarilytica]|uniref:PepSY-associated TM helix domain-containing protein n=1 Tax=Aquimarina agarilytica TaxID=1087449 RepID=UPI0002FFE595|nr:PepSY domain-containing protein [Aquimarina agarilytica]